MSKSVLLQEIINYLKRQRSMGKSVVYRTVIYAVLEDRVGAEAIGTGRAMTKSLMETAAREAGAIYLSEEGRARVLWN
jgi:hypothetical protein